MATGSDALIVKVEVLSFVNDAIGVTSSITGAVKSPVLNDHV